MNLLDNLIECLKAQNNLIEEFITTLQDEATALAENASNEAIIGITTKKNDYVQRIAKLEELRVKNLEALGFTDTTDSINSAFYQYPDLQPAFDKLWELAAQAQQINQENGAILANYIENNERALDTLKALMGMDLYDSSGKFENSTKK